MEVLSQKQVGDIVLSEYGCHVTSSKQLPGYCDLNYHVLLADEHKNQHISQVSADGYVLKILISDISQRLDLIKAWQDLIQHLVRHDLPVPRVTPTLNGELVSRMHVSGEHGRPAVVTMYQYIPGQRVDEVELASAEHVLRQVGELAGRTNVAMKTFVSPAISAYDLIGKIDAVDELSALVDTYSGEDDGVILRDIMKMYRDKLLPVKHILQKGIIHGDLNPQNILLRPIADTGSQQYEVAGLIDFEHSSESCYVFEIAITVAHMLKLLHDHKQFSVEFVCRNLLQAYMEHVILLDEEKNVFQLCVFVRLLQLFVLGTEALVNYPDNAYLRSHTEGNVEMITKVMEISHNDFMSRVFQSGILL